MYVWQNTYGSRLSQNNLAIALRLKLLATATTYVALLLKEGKKLSVWTDDIHTNTAKSL